MKVTVVGFGHFAGVVASCLAQRGHEIDQCDQRPNLLRQGQRLPASEAGYVPFVNYAHGDSPDLVWVAYDVPLDDGGAPVVDEVYRRCLLALLQTQPTVPFIISCQWPVGTMALVEKLLAPRPLCYVMENVRVGQAIKDFQHQPCVVLGCDLPDVPPAVLSLLSDLSPELLLLSSASAEMAKHATNAFMALQIAFINEIADLSRQVGATPADVAAVLLKDFRVRPNAPLIPGKPFGGGSLKRDLMVLESIILKNPERAYPIVSSIRWSNGDVA